MSLTPLVYSQPNKNFYFPRVVDNFSVLIVPGLHNSDEIHWQTLWQARLPQSKRIHVDDWSTPNLDAWRRGILSALASIKMPTVIIAHSFGALASASIAAEFPEKIAALFLVAPADPDKFSIAHLLPQNFLQMETKIIASSDDPWMTEQKAAYWALIWGADYLRIKNVGHINSQSDLGIWPLGMSELYRLEKKQKNKSLCVIKMKVAGYAVGYSSCS